MLSTRPKLQRQRKLFSKRKGEIGQLFLKKATLFDTSFEIRIKICYIMFVVIRK